MSLLRIEDASLNKAHRSDAILAIRASVIYFLGRGRNAWHNTWSMSYYPWSFHLNVTSAEKAAEHLRKQGSVFYVREVPAFVLETEALRYYVTELNSQDPLAQYRRSLEVDHIGVPTITPHGVLCPIAKGHPIGRALDSFSTCSRHWIQDSVKRGTVYILTEGGKVRMMWEGKWISTVFFQKSREVAPLRPDLRMWTSFSRGTSTALGWHLGERLNVRSASIQRLVKECG